MSGVQHRHSEYVDGCFRCEIGRDEVQQECLECSAPADSIGGHEMVGVDYDGTDALFWLDLIQCAAGHRYELVNEDRTVKLKEPWS